MSATAEKVNWKVQLHQHQQLKKKGATMLYERMTLLREISQDEEYEAWCVEQDVNVIDEMDREVDDTAEDFTTLLAVLEQFPRKSDWQTRGVKALIAETLQANKGEPRTRNVSKPGLKEKFNTAMQTIEEQAKEIERLRNELKVRDARISELEKVVRLMANGRRLDAGETA